jgi:hypothetical protein
MKRSFSSHSNFLFDQSPERNVKSLVAARSLMAMKYSPFSHLCSNTQSYILSYLEPQDILKFGVTCRESYLVSRSPFLWCKIEIRNAELISVKEICQLVHRSCPHSQPLTRLMLSASEDAIVSSCNCTLASGICSFCRQANGTSHLFALSPPSSSPSSLSHRQPLEVIASTSLHLRSLQNLQFSQIPCLTSQTFSLFLRFTPHLLSISIANNIDVNLIIQSIALSCPQLLSLSFNYVDVLNFESHDSALDYPLLSVQVSQELVRCCPHLKFIRLCHYTIDEDGASEILNLPQIESADLSDNECLLGEFLSNIPSKWPLLNSLILRDCLEIEDEHTSAFALQLAQGGCPLLSYVDCSCQWSFYNASLLFKPVREQLQKYRGLSETSEGGVGLTGAAIRWREDQCEIEGFGVDPEDGVDIHHLEMERIRSHSICSNSGIGLPDLTSAHCVDGEEYS